MNELVDLAKKNKNLCLLLKFDFEKAYDSVSCFFLDYMIYRFGFNDKWRCLIHACVFSCNFVVLVNGYLIQEVSIQRELKQGEPLAPFLFILVTEGLSGMFSRALDLQLFLGVRVGSTNLEVSHI